MGGPGRFSRVDCGKRAPLLGPAHGRGPTGGRRGRRRSGGPCASVAPAAPGGAAAQRRRPAPLAHGLPRRGGDAVGVSLRTRCASDRRRRGRGGRRAERGAAELTRIASARLGSSTRARGGEEVHRERRLQPLARQAARGRAQRVPVRSLPSAERGDGARAAKTAASSPSQPKRGTGGDERERSPSRVGRQSGSGCV